MSEQLIEARRSAYSAAVQRMEAADAAFADAEVDKMDELQQEFDDAIADVERTRGNLEAAEALARNAAKVKIDVRSNTADTQGETASDGHVDVRVIREESTYRPDKAVSFFRDIVHAGNDRDAADRLHRHRLETVETRDVTTSDPGAAGFIPPIYLAEKWAELPRPARPFVDALPKYPLPSSGETITVPKVQSGVTVASQATQNTAISETDIDTQSVTTPIRTIAGMQDLSVQSVERSYPGMDQIVYDDLRRAYEVQTEVQVLHGAGTSGTHTGIFAVSGTNSVSYTDATPTSAELLPKVYDALQQVESNRYSQADIIVMHPRRAAWLASNLGTSFPLFQLGGLYQAAGQQDMGMTEMIAGLRVLRTPNIATNLGAGTNEDAIAVLSRSDLMWMEGPLRIESFREVGSGTLTVRLRLYAFSAFVANRQPTGISKITGTGLIAPTF